MSRSGHDWSAPHYPRDWRRLLIGAFAVTVFAVVAGVGVVAIFPRLLDNEERQPAPIEQPSQPKAGSLTSVLQAFGRWTIVDTGRPTSESGILLLKPNGAAQQGTSQPAGTDTWENAVSPQIQDWFRRSDGIVLRTTSGRTFVVRYEQVFIFEDVPETAYAFVQTGVQLVSKPTQDIINGR